MPAERFPDLPDLDLSMLVKADLPDRIVFTTVDDNDCGCIVQHPRWCAWNGPCCDHCTHEGAAHAECCDSRFRPAEGES